MDAIEIKEIRRTNFSSSSSDVKHQKCQKELEIIYVSKKLTEEGLGSTTSLTKTQQSEV